MTQLHDLPVYDPKDERTRRNPFPLYEQLQDQDPVHWSPALKSWILTRYDDVRHVCMGQGVSSDRLRPFYDALKDERRDILSGVMRYLNHWLVFKAPPEHTRLRRLLNTVISAATVAETAANSVTAALRYAKLVRKRGTTTMRTMARAPSGTKTATA